MARINVGIFIGDQYYQNALVEFLNNEYKIRLDATVINFDKNDSSIYDVLVIDEKAYKEIDSDNNIIIISESITKSKQESICYINKFCNIHDIAATIFDLYMIKEENNGTVFLDKGNAKLISMYSPCGGIGVTTLSIILSIISAKNNLKTIYFDLSGNPASQYYLREDNNSDFESLIYFIKQNKYDPATILDAICKKHSKYGFSYIPIEKNIFSSCSEDELIEFILKMKTSNYDNIFFDLPHVLNMNINRVINESSKLIYLFENKSLELFKVNKNLEEIKINKETILISNKEDPSKKKPLPNFINKDTKLFNICEFNSFEEGINNSVFEEIINYV